MLNVTSSRRAAEALSLADLDQVAGGKDATHFVNAVVIPGTAEAGGAGSVDKTVATHTQVWVVSTS